jgi:hypothetical protein
MPVHIGCHARDENATLFGFNLNKWVRVATHNGNDAAERLPVQAHRCARRVRVPCVVCVRCMHPAVDEHARVIDITYAVQLDDGERRPRFGEDDFSLA